MGRTSYTLHQVYNMATTERSSILLRMTFAVLILAIWTGTTSAGQKCANGVKCVDFRYWITGKSYTKNQCAIGGVLGRKRWCATRKGWKGGNSGWDWGCKDCKADCWSGCGRKGGLCEDVCGTNGYCCRKGFNDCPNEAQQAAGSASHSCVRLT